MTVGRGRKVRDLTSARLGALAAKLRTNPDLATRTIGHLTEKATMPKSHDFTHVRIPNATIEEAQEIGEALRAFPAYEHMGNGKGRATATIRLAVERGFVALRAEIAKPPKRARTKR